MTTTTSRHHRHIPPRRPVPRRDLRWVLSCCAVLVSASAVTAAPVLGSSPQIHWVRTGHRCGPQAPVQIECGSVGVYHLDDKTISSPRCGPVGGVPTSEPLVGYSRPTTEDLTTWPCGDGSCFDPVDDHGGAARPSIAVIDWDDPHGWSVGAVVAEIAGPATFLALDEAWPELPQSLATAGDHHVLRQLCRLLDQPIAERPRFVNMSFGRFGGSMDNRCTSTSLGCEIDAVLHRLVADGATLFAAAGNDGELLFPASSDAVRAVGALDIADFRSKGDIAPTLETPAGVDVLMPGHGLVLPLDDGQVWGAPPGSSYASALATAWYAESTNSPLAETPTTWAGILSITETGIEDYRLRFTESSVPVASSHRPRAAAMVCSAVGCTTEVMTIVPEVPSDRTLELKGLGQLPAATFGDVARDGRNRPSPGSRPCIPCHDIPDNVLSLGATPGWADAGAASIDRAGFGPIVESMSSDDLSIDMSASVGLPTEYDLQALYLRVGTTVHAFSDSTHRALLDDLEVGVVATVVISQAPPGVWTEHTALIWVLETEDGTDFWHATPVAIHGHGRD